MSLGAAATPRSARPKSRAAEQPARERIVAASIEVFGALGFSKSTVQDIAATAGVSKPIFYRHFENKAHVFEVVIDRVCSEWYDAIVARTRELEGQTVECLRAILLETLAHTRSRPLLQRLLTRDSQLVLWTETDVLEQIHVRVRDLIQCVLEEGLASGEVRTDVPIAHLADAVNELVSAYAVRLVLGVAVEDALAESIAAFVARGVEPRPEPEAASREGAR